MLANCWNSAATSVSALFQRLRESLPSPKKRRVLATQWLGLESVLPCHYITLDGDKDVAEYMKHHRAAKARGEDIADPYLLRAGDWIEFDTSGKVVRPAKAA